MKILLQFSVVVLWLFFSTTVYAETNMSACSDQKNPQWWEITTGVLAIPAAVVGLAYSILLLKKTRLESRQIELDILEKEGKIAKIKTAHTEEIRQTIQPIIESRLVQFLFLRALVLYLVLHMWGLVEEGFEFVSEGTFVSVSKIFHINMDSPLVIIPFMVVEKLPRIGYWVIFFAVGWPIFKEANKLVGFNLKDFFTLKK